MSTALARVTEVSSSVAPRFGLLRPIAAPQEVLAAQEELRSMVATALKDGRDYGVIPGTNDKKVLLKPGAERLGAAFGLAPSFKIVEKEAEHDREVTWVKRKKVWANKHKGDKSFTWTEERGTALGLYRYVIECTLTHRESGAVVASALGTCSTLEAKYADRPRECENTVAKMSSKRALVAATLLALGLSDQFTQDIDEGEHDAPAPAAGKWDGPPPDDAPVAPAPVVELPPLTLFEAEALSLPEKLGGKPMGDTKLSQLKAFVAWVDKKDDASGHTKRMANGARLVIAKRDAEIGAATAGVAVGAVTPGEAAKILDAAENAAGDDLPFA